MIYDKRNENFMPLENGFRIKESSDPAAIKAEKSSYEMDKYSHLVIKLIDCRINVYSF